jgi:hypothetical protein
VRPRTPHFVPRTNGADASAPRRCNDEYWCFFVCSPWC